MTPGADPAAPGVDAAAPGADAVARARTRARCR